MLPDMTRAPHGSGSTLLAASLAGALALASLVVACGDDKPPSVAPITPPPAADPPPPPMAPAPAPAPANVVPVQADGDNDPLGGPSGTQVGTGLAPVAIQRVVRQSLPTIKKCNDSAPNMTPPPEGRVVVTFTIEKDGTVKTVGDTGSTLPDPRVVACVLQTFRTMTFPAPDGGTTVTATYPFKFQNQAGTAPMGAGTGATTAPANPASTTPGKPKTAPASTGPKAQTRVNPLDVQIKK